jgi:hypothetical protein
MEVAMLPKFVTAFLKSSGDQGVVIMEHDGTHRVIVVDQEALREMSNPPRADETRLQQSRRDLRNRDDKDSERWSVSPLADRGFRVRRGGVEA